MRALVFVALAMLVGCGADSPSRIGGLAGGESYRLDWGPTRVAHGEEDTQCVVRSLGNTERIRVKSVHNKLQATSHHFIVYKVNDTVERPEPYPCVPFADTLDPSRGAPLMVTQKKDELLALPPGVAFTLEPNQLIRLELHYINAADNDSTAAASAEFVTMGEDEYQQEADFLFIGNVDVRIPPRERATLGPTYFPLPPDLKNVNFFGITGHTHQWGTNVSVATAEGPRGPDSAVYDVKGFQWNEPATVIHDPPFQVPPDGGFRFTCSWHNLSDTEVSFGESANEEMCFFWTYYYPSQGARVCFHSDEVGGDDGVSLCCPGDPLCQFLGKQ